MLYAADSSHDKEEVYCARYVYRATYVVDAANSRHA